MPHPYQTQGWGLSLASAGTCPTQSGEPEPAEQILEPRIRAHKVKAGIDFEPNHPCGALLAGFPRRAGETLRILPANCK